MWRKAHDFLSSVLVRLQEFLIMSLSVTEDDSYCSGTVRRSVEPHVQTNVLLRNVSLSPHSFMYVVYFICSLLVLPYQVWNERATSIPKPLPTC
jgi:hypothetical protein